MEPAILFGDNYRVARDLQIEADYLDLRNRIIVPDPQPESLARCPSCYLPCSQIERDGHGRGCYFGGLD